MHTGNQNTYDKYLWLNLKKYFFLHLAYEKVIFKLDELHFAVPVFFL